MHKTIDILKKSCKNTNIIIIIIQIFFVWKKMIHKKQFLVNLK